MLYQWIKILHIVFVVAWFSGLFYLPRLFVYHADVENPDGDRRFQLMERKLYAFTSMNASIAVVLALGLVAINPSWLQQSWLQAKILLVAAVIAYHLWCGRLTAAFARGENDHSGLWYRWINEIPVLLLFAIVALVILKPA